MKEEIILRIIAVLLLGTIVYNVTRTILPGYTKYFEPYYTEAIYKDLERVFNESQYRKKDNPAIVPDETIFSYAAGAYLHGIDPILVNSETTPLGKYMIAASILILKNDKFIAIPFVILTLIALWILGRQILRNSIFALIPVAVFSSERLFLSQLWFTPLLDIIQLPFILLAIASFIYELPKERFFFTSVLLGAVMSTKTIIPAMLLLATFSLYLLMRRSVKELLILWLWLPAAFVILLLSYARTFLDGYSLRQFLGFQKWIFLYQKSKLLYPLSVWRLLLFNQWQTWWGSFAVVAAEDWQWTWPVSTVITVLGIVAWVAKKIKLEPSVELLNLWFVTYGVFLSLGVVSSRFLLPLLPVSFILTTYAILRIINKISKRFV